MVDMKFSEYPSVPASVGSPPTPTSRYLQHTRPVSSPAGQEPGLFDAVIVNDNLEDAYEQLKGSLIEVSARVGELCWTFVGSLRLHWLLVGCHHSSRPLFAAQEINNVKKVSVSS